MPVIIIKKRDGTVLQVIVSDEDYAEAVTVRWHMAGGKGRVGKYAVSVKHGYLHRWVAQRMGLLDSIAPEAGQRGRWKVSIDHVNGDKLDCRRENLRLRDRPHQMRNPNDRPRSTNKSGFRGVSYVKLRERFGKPWMAYVTVNYKTVNLGWYATAEEAAAARRRWDEEAAVS